MKKLVLRLVHVVIIALAGIFGEYAPVSENIGKYVFWAAFGIGFIKLVCDFALEVKEGKYFNRYLTMAVSTGVLFYFGNYLSVILTMIIFFAVDILCDYIALSHDKKAENLSKIIPAKARVYNDGKLVEIDAKDLLPGRIAIVKQGEIIPSDGRLFNQGGEVDISFLTGKRKTAKVTKDQDVFAGSINMGKTMQVEITKHQDDSIFVHMIRKTQNAMNNEEDGFIDNLKMWSKVGYGIIVAATLILSFGPPMIGGFEYEPWIYRGMILLTAASFDKIPYIIEITVKSLIYDLFFKGVVTDRDAVYNMADTTGILLEKSQRFAEGIYVIDHIEEVGCSKEELITMAGHIEYFSDHLIAKALVDGYIQVARYQGVVDINPVKISLVDSFEEIKGKGVTGNVAGKFTCVGNKKLMDLLNIKNLPHSDEFELIYVAIDQKYCGCFALKYMQKPGVEDVYAAWSDAGISKYAILEGREEDVSSELRSEIGENEKIAFVGVDNHHGESKHADVCVIVDCLENKMLSNGDMEMMDCKLSDIADVKSLINNNLSHGMKLVYFLAGAKVVYIVSALMALPLCIPVLLDGIVEGFVVRSLFKAHKRPKKGTELEEY